MLHSKTAYYWIQKEKLFRILDPKLLLSSIQLILKKGGNSFDLVLTRLESFS